MSSAVEPDRRCWLASPDSRPSLSCSSRSKCHALDSRGEAGQTMRRDQDELTLQHRRDSPSSQNADPTRALTWSRLCCRKKQASSLADERPGRGPGDWRQATVLFGFRRESGLFRPPRVMDHDPAEKPHASPQMESCLSKLSAPPTALRPDLFVSQRIVGASSSRLAANDHGWSCNRGNMGLSTGPSEATIMMQHAATGCRTFIWPPVGTLLVVAQ